MRKYLGSRITAVGAVIAPFFLCGPLLFGIITLYSQISGATIFISLLAFACSFVWGIYMKRISNQLFSWGLFAKDHIQIMTGFSKTNMLVYEKCKSCGIAFYTHGLLNSCVGTKIYFIYLSYDLFDNFYQEKINLWKPSSTRIKVQFSQELYDYLITILPRKQSRMLSQDYKKYFM